MDDFGVPRFQETSIWVQWECFHGWRVEFWVQFWVEWESMENGEYIYGIYGEWMGNMWSIYVAGLNFGLRIRYATNMANNLRWWNGIYGEWWIHLRNLWRIYGEYIGNIWEYMVICSMGIDDDFIESSSSSFDKRISWESDGPQMESNNPNNHRVWAPKR